MIRKYLICPERRRYVPKQFSWVDHRLVRHGYICGCSKESLALYLFLITVSDGEGLSYYSDTSICKYLITMRHPTLLKARKELIAADLIAYEDPIYQVLALDRKPISLNLSIPRKSKGNDEEDDNEEPRLSSSPVKPTIPPSPSIQATRLKQGVHIGNIIDTIIGKELS